MKHLILMCGFSGAGKSTLAKKLSEKFNIPIVSRDEIRFSYLDKDPHAHYFDYEKKVFKDFVKAGTETLKKFNSVIMDATHLNKVSRSKLLRNFSDVKVTCIIVDTCVAKCIKQNKLRSDYKIVPDNIIHEMANRFEMPSFDEGIDTIVLYRENDEYPFRIKTKEVFGE